ncbi:MAG: disulfide bond formation protein B [Chlamydiia bacterium]|nr:disulfide bond formation protein B [Chlamydiia bacterium]
MTPWHRTFFIILLIVSVLALGVSYYVEYVMEIPPCMYCKSQRWMYFLLILLSFGALFTKWKKGILWGVRVVLLIGLAIATLHTIKEFTGGSCGCASRAPSWKIFGLPAPLYNSVLTLVLLIGAIFTKGSSKE